MKRIVIQHPDGLMQIAGLSEGDAQPPAMVVGPDGPLCLVAAKRLYYLYKPLMVPSTGRLNETFDPRQV